MHINFRGLLGLTTALALSACSMLGHPEAASDNAVSLHGQWRVVRVNERPASPLAMLNFDGKSGRFAAYFGCNHMMGSYSHQGGRLSFSHIASTLMACGNADGDFQGASALSNTRSAAIEAVKTRGGQRLILRDEAGKVVLEAEPIATVAREGGKQAP